MVLELGHLERRQEMPGKYRNVALERDKLDNTMKDKYPVNTQLYCSDLIAATCFGYLK